LPPSEPIEFGKDEEDDVGRYLGTAKLAYYIDFGRTEEKAAAGGSGLVGSRCELDTFERAYRRKKFAPAAFQRGQVVAGFVGVDGGSTSTKAALLDENGDILCKAYQLSNGNPIEDTKQMFEKLRAQGRIRAPGWKCWAPEPRATPRTSSKTYCMPTWRWSKLSRIPSRPFASMTTLTSSSTWAARISS
jgi:hypothetical protein